MDDHRPKLRKLLERLHILRSLTQELQDVIDQYERRLKAARIIIPLEPSNIIVQHAVPSQGEIDVVSRVLNTSELLDNIWQRLPNYALARMRRVFRQLKATIDTGPIGQTKIAAGRRLGTMLKLVQLELPDEGWTFLATVTAPNAIKLLEDADVCNVQVRDQPVRVIMLRQVCNMYHKIDTSDPVVVCVPSGVGYGHIFATLDELLVEGWMEPWTCRLGDECNKNEWDIDERSHEIQIDVSWQREWRMDPWRYSETPLYNVVDRQETLEAWRKELRRMHRARFHYD